MFDGISILVGYLMPIFFFFVYLISCVLIDLLKFSLTFDVVDPQPLLSSTYRIKKISWINLKLNFTGARAWNDQLNDQIGLLRLAVCLAKVKLKWSFSSQVTDFSANRILSSGFTGQPSMPTFSLHWAVAEVQLAYSIAKQNGIW